MAGTKKEVGGVSSDGDLLVEVEVIRIGEFEISRDGDSLLVRKDDGEAMELNPDTLRRIWDENF